MINDQHITQLIEKEISHTVNTYVSSILADHEWQSQLEKQITEFVQGRITAKFQNICELPNIVAVIQERVDTLFSQGTVPGIEKFVDHAAITQTVDSCIQKLISQSIENLVADPAWMDKIQQHVTVNMAARVSEQISAIDINSVIAQTVDQGLDKWKHKFSENFYSTGIKDVASSCELVISDGVVMAQSGLACESIMVENDVTTKNLVVTGTINTDCASWNELSQKVAQDTQELLGAEWQKTLVQQVLETAKTQGIDFDTITVKGSPLVQGNCLNHAITETRIQQLGVLHDLQVAGATKLANTVYINHNRLGINTDSPEMALMLWDEEVSITLGKISKDRAWIGTNRKQTLDIGIDRKKSISIEPDGLVVVDRFRLDRWRIAFGNSVPNHSGTRGDVVINHDPKPNTPFAWQCLGGFKWQSIDIR